MSDLTYITLDDDQYLALDDNQYLTLTLDGSTGLTKDSILVLYREDNDDSYAFAKYYQEVHQLGDEQLVPLPCSGNEILANYSDFQNEIETPLNSFLSSTYVMVKGFLVGYGVPGGFYNSGDIVATTSRLSRIGHTFSKGMVNPLFNRAIYEPLDEYDTQTVLVASRIDAPSLSEAKDIVKNSIKVIRRSIARGTFFFDPYTVLSDSDESDYFDELDDFGNLILPLLNLKTFTTKFWDEYTDIVVPRLENDSFMWSWKADKTGFTFFKNTSTPRVFLYNADNDSGYSLRDYSYRYLPILALKSGYVSCAGAMSDPSAIGHLRPTPFFDALLRGATVGEAFIYACPMLDWTVSLFGDPLIAIKFPTGSSVPENVSTTSVFEQMHDNLASSIAYLLQKDVELENALNSLVAFTEIDKAPIMSLFNAAAIDNAGSWKVSLLPVLKSFINYWTGNNPKNFNKYLTDNSLKISSLLPLLLEEKLAVGNQYDEGFWKVETAIHNPTVSAHKFHFELDIADDVDFASMIDQFSSKPSSINYSSYFSYEKNAGSFVAIPAAGVSSGYSGRRVRFSSPEVSYLNRGRVFYWRIRQIYDMSATDYITAKAIIFT